MLVRIVSRAMDDATESYIMLLLADGNLPTGSFVASSGLESYVKHGFFGTSLSNKGETSTSSSAARSNQAIVDFMEDNLGSYARSALPFVSDVHIVVEAYRVRNITETVEEATSLTLRRLSSLDDLYHSMTLNDVTRRASQAQGVALLTLFSKGFSEPQLVRSNNKPPTEYAILHLVDELKLMIRREEVHGHLPICWGVLTAALGLSLERSQYLHLFLQARSLLSASIRLNTIGPYAAQQLLLHVVKGIVERQMKICQALRTGLQDTTDGDGEVLDNLQCPASTWPLGEILAARHDLLHSRIFNS